jgi:YfiH family protein
MPPPSQTPSFESHLPRQRADGRAVAPSVWVAPTGVSIVRIEPWLNGPEAEWLWHGFSTRRGGFSRAYGASSAEGDLNHGFTAEDERENVARNRQLLAESVTGDPGTPLLTLKQVHSSLVVAAGGGDVDRVAPHEADGLMTDQPGLLVGVQTADCMPVLVADRRRRVVAAFHAGWRGTAKRIVESGVARMREAFDCSPDDLTAAIGPGIGACCYAIGEEVFSTFKSNFTYAIQLFHEVSGRDGSALELHVDLAEANRRQLLDAGLSAAAIYTTGGCTSCHPELFFSHRASGGHAGRMMSVIGIRKGL